MLAIEGRYDNGRVELDEKAPVDRSKVIVLFPMEKPVKKEKMSTEEAFRILDKYKGSIKGDLNAKTERLAYLDERYGNKSRRERKFR